MAKKDCPRLCAPASRIGKFKFTQPLHNFFALNNEHTYPTEPIVCLLRQISCLGTPLNSWSAGDNESLAMAWWTDRNDETHLHWTGDGLDYGKGDFEGGGGGCACGRDGSCLDPKQGRWFDCWERNDCLSSLGWALEPQRTTVLPLRKGAKFAFGVE